jgi:dUTP pyrophosphatase
MELSVGIDIQLLEVGFLPTRATKESAGWDLYSPISSFLDPDERQLISLGFKIAIPDGYMGLIYPRSGLALKYGITVANAPGLIDADYRGEVGVILINHSKSPYHFSRKDRIAQLVIAPVIGSYFYQVNQLPKTERNDGGFGSSGF